MTRRGICEVLGRYFDHSLAKEDIDVFMDGFMFATVSDATTWLMFGTNPHMETFQNAGLRLPIYRDGADLVLGFEVEGEVKREYVLETFEDEEEDEDGEYIDDDAWKCDDAYDAMVEERLMEGRA